MRDYQYFRKIMADEANAAIEGAFIAGATEVVVRDSHGDKRNTRHRNERGGPASGQAPRHSPY